MTTTKDKAASTKRRAAFGRPSDLRWGYLGSSVDDEPAPRLAERLFTPKKTTPQGLAQAADGRMADVVAAGDVRQRLEAFVAARDRLAALVRCQLGRTTEQRHAPWRACGPRWCGQ